MLTIKVPDMNDSFSRLNIGQEEYQIRFTYNEKFDYWSFGIYTAQKEPIIAMTKIIPGFPLLLFYSYHSLPQGQFACISGMEHVGRESFNKKEAEFVFIPNSEIEEA